MDLTCLPARVSLRALRPTSAGTRAFGGGLLLAAALSPGLADAGDQDPAEKIALEPVVTAGLREPVYVTHAPGDGGRLFVVEQAGRIRIVRDGQLLDVPFLDISPRVRTGGERGLLGLAFHPRYADNGRFVVSYTRAPDGASVVAEYRRSEDPNVARTTERRLLVVPQPYANHNGGMIAFGPDRLLYVGLGDGGSAGDPGNRAQSRRELLGKIVRIDVDRGKPYAIPPSNPFPGGKDRGEIFAYGFRNPWRFSFDRATGALWVGDVGQSDWEEVNVVRRGGNYGWRVMEGRHCFRPRRHCAVEGLVPPVAEYRNRGERCSVIGGYVYRGRAIPALAGIYVFADHCSGEIFGLLGGVPRVLLWTRLRIASLGQDPRGELYVVGHGGTRYRKEWFSRGPRSRIEQGFGVEHRGSVHRIVARPPQPGAG